MPKPRSTFSFKSTLSSVKGSLMPCVIFLPEEITEALPPGKVRTKGTLNGVPFALAPQYKKGGIRFFSVSAALRKAARIKEGDKVEVVFRLVDPSVVDMPEELEAVLAQDDKAMAVWNTFPTGLQRSLVHYITSVKNVDSRITRSLQMMEKAKAGLLHSQQLNKAPKPTKKKSMSDE
jgi:hypothetical protein